MTVDMNWHNATQKVQKAQRDFYIRNGAAITTALVTTCTLEFFKRRSVPTILLVGWTGFVAYTGIRIFDNNTSGYHSKIKDIREEESKKLSESKEKFTLNPQIKEALEATKTLPKLFNSMDISDLTFEKLDLPETAVYAKNLPYLQAGIHVGLWTFELITCLHLAKTFVEALFVVVKHQKIPQMKALIPTIFHFGKSCIWGERSVVGDHFLRTIQAAILTFTLDRILDVVALKRDLATERFNYVLNRKIELALSSDQLISQELTKSLKEYSPFLTTYTLKEAKGDRLAEIGAAFQYTTQLTIENLTEPKEESLKDLKNLTRLNIEKSDALDDAWLEKTFQNLPHLKRLVIEKAPHLKGIFWKALPLTVKAFKVPEFDGADQLGVSLEKGATKGMYEKIIIGKISEKGAKQLKDSLYAKELTIGFLEKLDSTEKWEKKDLEEALKSYHILKINLPT